MRRLLALKPAAGAVQAKSTWARDQLQCLCDEDCLPVHAAAQMSPLTSGFCPWQRGAGGSLQLALLTVSSCQKSPILIEFFPFVAFSCKKGCPLVY